MPHSSLKLRSKPNWTWAFPVGSTSEPILPRCDIPIPELITRSMDIWAPKVEPIGIVVTAYAEASEGKRHISAYALVQSLPDVFLRDSVRHLCLHDVEAPQMLERCDEVVNLYMTWANPALFTLIEPMILRQLWTNIGDLLNHFRTERLTHYVFSDITHLTLFDKVRFSTWEEWADLKELPSLTHLSLDGEISFSLLHGVLANCPGLEVFLNQWQELAEIQPEEYCATSGVTDFRFVMAETDESVCEWEHCARGEMDMWDRAAMFVARKNAGDIRETLFWIPEEYEIDSEEYNLDSEIDPEDVDSHSDDSGSELEEEEVYHADVVPQLVFFPSEWESLYDCIDSDPDVTYNDA
ncbi:hypothetical protein B0H16DRAFT_1534002 [Mycena metata]|uniref:Uncharacterized protein n=1 Tax=Mycena metata TaxID=1033252 RepID=A0AAD7NGA8_9AGAR|nr:hypothetical protein B0H16DRAFT_1534002 [Mycena metata]